MAAGLQTQLVNLHSCLNGGDAQGNATKAHDITGALGHVCLQDISEKDVDYSASLVFDKENGIPAFLRKVVSLEEYKTCKEELLQLLTAFIDKWREKVVPYSVIIKEGAVSAFRDSKSAVKVKSLVLLVKILEFTSGSKLGDELKVPEMCDKFLMELVKASKHTPTVKREIYNLLGVLAEVHPEKMINYSERLIDLFMKTLKTEMTAKTRKPELSIIAGCLQGLTGYLVNFTQSVEEGAKYSYDIFDCMRKCMSSDMELSRFDMPRAALSLMAKHAAQFNQYLIDDHERIYSKLVYWTNHVNREMQHLGTVAMEAFLKQISEMLVEKAKQGKKDVTLKGTFVFFIQKFRATMDNPEATRKEIAVAIRGYGHFAAPCRVFLNASDVKFMFNEMIQRSEQVFFSNMDSEDDKMINLPSFLDALASIIKELDEVSDTFLVSLEKLVVMLIEQFPRLHQKLHFLCFLSILRVLISLTRKGATFRGFLSKIVYQGVIRTCWHPVVLVTEEQPTDGGRVTEDDLDINEKKVSYKDYIPFWSYLLDSARVKSLAAEGIGLEQRELVTNAIYDELIISVLRIVERLDLTSNKPSEIDTEENLNASTSSDTSEAGGDVVTDPVHGLHASKPKDFIIFINLVDFCRDLLPNQHRNKFERWVFTFGHDVILHSTKYPLVSGFYKLLGVCMKICAKISYFKGIGGSIDSVSMAGGVKTENGMWIKVENDSEDQEMTEATNLTQKQTCYLLFTKFTKEVVSRMKQYKDDLLASCLSFILSLPHEIVISQLSTLVPAIQLTFRMGRSYLPLAEQGLDALELWRDTLPEHVLKPFYPQILPYLDAYLKTPSDATGEGKTLIVSLKSDRNRKGRKKIPVKLLKQDKANKTKEASHLETVQKRCVHLLGSLGGSINSCLLTVSAAELAKTAVAWDTEKHLRFDVPFQDVKPVIYLDAFLPRVVELASTSSDRQTKVAACELLHSLVLYMLGRGAMQPGRARQAASPMTPLYKKVFPVLMELACDVEQVSRQLFEPLMFQLIHWFSSNQDFENKDTAALLDTLMDGVVCPTDTALRDFSAKSIKEFLKWSLKQKKKKEIEKNPKNVKSLLKRIYSLARHPSAFKRLGAALAFNNIYTVLREEESLVDMFIFEIMANFVESLALAHQDDKSLGTQEQCRLALTHIERIIDKKSGLLAEKSKRQRKVPKDWSEQPHLLLALRWLLRQCGRPQTECRHVCMQLIFNLAKCLPGFKSAQQFLEKLRTDTEAGYYLKRFEHGLYKTKGKMGLAQCSNITQIAVSFSTTTAVHWFDIFLATLDCYCWVFGQGLLKPDKILVGADKKGTVVFKAISYFVEYLAMEDIIAASKLFEVKLESSIFTPREVDEYNKAKCTAVVRIFNFLCTMLAAPNKDASLKVIPGSLWTNKLWDLIIACALEPTSVGFNMGDVEVMMNLPEQISQMLIVVNKCLPAKLTDAFIQRLEAKLGRGSSGDLLTKLPEGLSESNSDPLQMQHLVMGYEQLHKSGLLSSGLGNKAAALALSQEILDTVFKSMTKKENNVLCSVTLTPTLRDLAKKLLDLSILIGVKVHVMLDHLLDKTLVENKATHSSSPHGALFYVTFRSVLNGYLVRQVKDVIPLLVKNAKKEPHMVRNLLVGIMDHIGRDREFRKKNGQSVVDTMMGHWSALECWWCGDSQETKSLALSLLTKAILIDQKFVQDVKHPAFGDVFKMYRHLLTDKSSSLLFKSKVLDLLMFFGGFPQRARNETEQLKSSLDSMVADNFPMKSSEFKSGTPKYNEYITALQKILAAMEISGSLMLLELLISIMCRESQHVYEEEIQNSIIRFIKRMPRDKHKLAVDVPYEIFMKEGSFPDEIRRATLERVALSMLRVIHTPALTEFFMDHIKEIMKVVEAKQIKGSEYKTQMVSKLCCLQLMEVLYSRLDQSELKGMDSRINSIYCNGKPQDGKELTKTITTEAHRIKKEDMRGETTALVLRRELHCAAYNALIAIISCTQTEEKFYHAFLFKDDPDKGQFLWDNIIDKDRAYSFDIEMDNPLARRRKFVAIRNEIRNQPGNSSEDDEESFRLRSKSVHYLASQYLADSSLSMDVSQYDFTGTSASSFVGSSSSSYEGGKRSRSFSRRSTLSSSGNEQDISVTIKDDYVEMEMDAVNQHECMAPLTALLQHMARNNIAKPPAEKGAIPQEKDMQEWMKVLLHKLTSSRTERNVKIFIAKLVINVEEVFRHWAKFWIGPIVQLIVSGSTGSPGIHYFVTDLVVTILSWHTVAIPEDSVVDRAMASRLLEFLMENCHHTNRSVLRNNLEVIKTLVEVWKSRIEVPTKVIYDQFSVQDPKDPRCGTGLQLMGVVLANKLPPYVAGCGIRKETFFEKLATNMGHPSKPVYSASAEVVGMALQHMSEKETAETDKKWRDKYIDLIAKMLYNTQVKSPDIFVTCLYKMQQHYAPVVDKFANKVLFLLPKLPVTYRVNCLEIILSRLDSIDDIFLQLKEKNILDILTYRDTDLQQVALKIVHKMLRQLQPSELLYLLHAVSGFTSHPSASCRSTMYEIFMWIYDNYKENEEPEANEILKVTKDSLLQGLSDADIANRLTLQNFWSHETRLPAETIDRLVAMLEAMYSPQSESKYLSYATNLLLEMTSKSPDFNREIFEHPLSECKFEDYRVLSHWRQRHAAMTPLFVDSQASQQLSPSDDSNVSVMESHNVRATQDDVQFTPTQQAGGKGPYNWLTQSSLDTYAGDFNLTLPTTTQSESSLLFTIGKSGPKKAGPGFGKGKLARPKSDQVDGASQSQSSQGGGSEILRLKRRFVRDSEQAKIFFIKRQSRLKELREKVIREQKQQRENQVTMYRKYRIGDLPDIQIKYSAIIAPLQGLAQRDSSVGRILFSSVFKAIFGEIEKEKTEREARETIEKIAQGLNKMLRDSTNFYPAFIACVHDIVQGYPKMISLDAAEVFNACKTSMQPPLGITLLEETLIQKGEEEERPSKRARGATGSKITLSGETKVWIELAKLYKELDDFDVLRGIFSSKVGTQQLTMQAMEAEMRSDFLTARNLYTEGLDKDDWGTDGPITPEVDLWDVSRLQCCANLAQWENLEAFSTENIDDKSPPDLNKLWDDTFYQENYMPFMIRSKLKQLLLGDDNHQDLFKFVDSALQSGIPERRAVLERNFSEELALMYLYNDDFDRARYYAGCAVETFLQDWSSMDSLQASSRANALQKLQRLTELQEFLTFISRDDNVRGFGPATGIVNGWMKRSPDLILDSVGIWDDVVTNRCIYIDKMSYLIQKSGTAVKMEEDEEVFDSFKVRLRLCQADSARSQENFIVALKQLSQTHSVVKRSSDEELRLCWTHTYARTHHQKCQSQVSNMVLGEKVKSLSGTISQLEKVGKLAALNANRSLAMEHNGLKGECISALISTLQADAISLDELDGDLLSKVQSMANTTKTSYDEVVNSLLETGYQHFKKSVSYAKQEEESARDVSVDLSEANKAHMALVLFCDNFVRQRDDDEESPLDCASMDRFPEAMIMSHLTAMKNGSVEARQRFPRLLQIVDYHPETITTFREKSSEVPCWMFIGWISQIIALLDKPESPAVQNLLLEMAQQYPEALIYPFKMSDEGYQFSSDANGKKAQEVRNRLHKLLSKNKLVDLFIEALEQLNQPNAIFKDWMDDVNLLYRKKKLTGTERKEQLLQKYKELYNEILNTEAESEASLYQSSQATNTLPDRLGYGNYRKNFADDFCKKIESKFGKQGRKLPDMDSRTFDGIAKSLYTDMNDASKGKLAPPLQLKGYTEYLATYNMLDSDRVLEIPGQYGGDKKPMPEYHTKISSFDERVLVMSSIRRPKKIVIRGNDEKDYPFLVKGGEDLRQDQRIEQLFDIMNKVMAEDANCKQRKLSLRTYQVVPMTPRVGMIEWMNGTKPMKEFLLNTLTDKERTFMESNKGPKAAHNNFIADGGNYLGTYKNCSRTDTINSFKKREDLVPWDLMRRAYLNMSASTEAYFTLRSNFAVSHSLVCICQYILGIGDRHLSNFMIDLETGCSVGIDFGHSFGSATQFLPFPELMPFRMTRQIRNLMMPLREKGLMEGTMIHTLRALRNNSDLLMCTMDVFIKEPSLDWKLNAERQKRLMGVKPNDELDADTEWFPKQKVEYARRKLSGYNPCYITKDELVLGHSKKAECKYIQAVAMGDKTHDIRAKLGEKQLSPEQQVACLLNQATDRNILGRVWAGWEPWM